VFTKLSNTRKPEHTEELVFNDAERLKLMMKERLLKRLSEKFSKDFVLDNISKIKSNKSINLKKDAMDKDSVDKNN